MLQITPAPSLTAMSIPFPSQSDALLLLPLLCSLTNLLLCILIPVLSAPMLYSPTQICCVPYTEAAHGNWGYGLCPSSSCCMQWSLPVAAQHASHFSRSLGSKGKSKLTILRVRRESEPAHWLDDLHVADFVAEFFVQGKQ